MTGVRHIVLLAIPGLMLCLVPIDGIDLRFGWQLASIWLAGVAFMAFLSSWWWRIFFYMVLLQTIIAGPVAVSYIQLLLIGIFLAAAEKSSRMDTGKIMDALCVGGLILCGWIFLQHLGILGTFGKSYIAGPFNINAASVFLALCLIAFFRDRYRWVFIPVVFAGLFLCRSTTGMIAALAGCIVFLLFSKLSTRRLAAVGIAGMLLAGVFFIKIDPAKTIITSPRWSAWRHVVLSYRSAPLGRGLGSFAQLFPLMTLSDPNLCPTGLTLMDGKTRVMTTKWPVWNNAHNEYLQAGFEIGLQAVALIVAYLICLLWAALRMRKTITDNQRLALSGMTVLFVSCLGWNTFHIAPLALAGCAWLGVAHKEIGRR
jgi:O-antigen ligase